MTKNLNREKQINKRVNINGVPCKNPSLSEASRPIKEGTGFDLEGSFAECRCLLTGNNKDRFAHLRLEEPGVELMAV